MEVFGNSDLLDMIVRILPPGDHARCRAVSRDFKCAAERPPIWECMYFEHDDDVSVGEMEYVARNMRGVHVVLFNRCVVTVDAPSSRVTAHHEEPEMYDCLTFDRFVGALPLTYAVVFSVESENSLYTEYTSLTWRREHVRFRVPELIMYLSTADLTDEGAGERIASVAKRFMEKDSEVKLHYHGSLDMDREIDLGDEEFNEYIDGEYRMFVAWLRKNGFREHNESAASRHWATVFLSGIGYVDVDEREF